MAPVRPLIDDKSYKQKRNQVTDNNVTQEYKEGIARNNLKLLSTLRNGFSKNHVLSNTEIEDYLSSVKTSSEIQKQYPDLSAKGREALSDWEELVASFSNLFAEKNDGELIQIAIAAFNSASQYDGYAQNSSGSGTDAGYADDGSLDQRKLSKKQRKAARKAAAAEAGDRTGGISNEAEVEPQTVTVIPANKKSAKLLAEASGASNAKKGSKISLSMAPVPSGAATGGTPTSAYRQPSSGGLGSNAGSPLSSKMPGTSGGPAQRSASIGRKVTSNSYMSNKSSNAMKKMSAQNAQSLMNILRVIIGSPEARSYVWELANVAKYFLSELTDTVKDESSKRYEKVNKQDDYDFDEEDDEVDEEESEYLSSSEESTSEDPIRKTASNAKRTVKDAHQKYREKTSENDITTSEDAYDRTKVDNYDSKSKSKKRNAYSTPPKSRTTSTLKNDDLERDEYDDTEYDGTKNLKGKSSSKRMKNDEFSSTAKKANKTIDDAADLAEDVTTKAKKSKKEVEKKIGKPINKLNAKDAKKAVNEATTVATKSMRKVWEEKIPNSKKETLEDHLYEVVSSIIRKRKYQENINQLLDNFLYMFDRLLRTSSKKWNTKVNEESQQQRRYGFECIRLLIERMAGNLSMEELLVSAKDMKDCVINDDELQRAVNLYGRFLRQTLTEPGFIEQDDWADTHGEIRKMVMDLVNERYKPQLDKLFKNLRIFLTAVYNDPYTKKFRVALGRFISTLFLDRHGNITFKKDIWSDVVGKILPAVAEHIRYIPLPSIQFDRKKDRYFLSNIIVGLDDSLPNIFEVNLWNAVNLGFHDRATIQQHKMTVGFYQVHANIKDIVWVYQKMKKNGTYKLYDRGFMDVLLGGQGFSSQLQLNLNPESKYRAVEIISLDTTVDKLKLRPHGAKYNFFYKLAMPVVRRRIRKAIIERFNLYVRELVDKVNKQLVGGREGKLRDSQRKRLKAQRKMQGKAYSATDARKHFRVTDIEREITLNRQKEGISDSKGLYSSGKYTKRPNVAVPFNKNKNVGFSKSQRKKNPGIDSDLDKDGLFIGRHVVAPPVMAFGDTSQKGIGNDNNIIKDFRGSNLDDNGSSTTSIGTSSDSNDDAYYANSGKSKGRKNKSSKKDKQKELDALSKQVSSPYVASGDGTTRGPEPPQRQSSRPSRSKQQPFLDESMNPDIKQGLNKDSTGVQGTGVGIGRFDHSYKDSPSSTVDGSKSQPYADKSTTMDSPTSLRNDMSPPASSPSKMKDFKSELNGHHARDPNDRFPSLVYGDVPTEEEHRRSILDDEEANKYSLNGQSKSKFGIGKDDYHDVEVGSRLFDDDSMKGSLSKKVEDSTSSHRGTSPSRASTPAMDALSKKNGNNATTAIMEEDGKPLKKLDDSSNIKTGKMTDDKLLLNLRTMKASDYKKMKSGSPVEPTTDSKKVDAMAVIDKGLKKGSKKSAAAAKMA